MHQKLRSSTAPSVNYGAGSRLAGRSADCPGSPMGRIMALLVHPIDVYSNPPQSTQTSLTRPSWRPPTESSYIARHIGTKFLCSLPDLLYSAPTSGTCSTTAKTARSGVLGSTLTSRSLDSTESEVPLTHVTSSCVTLLIVGWGRCPSVQLSGLRQAIHTLLGQAYDSITPVDYIAALTQPGPDLRLLTWTAFSTVVNSHLSTTEDALFHSSKRPRRHTWEPFAICGKKLPLTHTATFVTSIPCCPSSSPRYLAVVIPC